MANWLPSKSKIDVYTPERDRAENLSIERVDLMENTDVLVVTQFAQNIGDGDPLDELLQSPPVANSACHTARTCCLH